MTLTSIIPYINKARHYPCLLLITSHQMVYELPIVGGDQCRVAYYTGITASVYNAASATTVLHHWNRLSDHVRWKTYPPIRPSLDDRLDHHVRALAFFLEHGSLPLLGGWRIQWEHWRFKKWQRLPLRSLLTKPVVISIVNYGTLALLDTAASTLIPLIWSTAIELGGLCLTPVSIGLWISVYGCVSAVFQFAFFPRVVAFGMSYALFPFGNMLARDSGTASVVWPLIVPQLLYPSRIWGPVELGVHVCFFRRAEQAIPWQSSALTDGRLDPACGGTRRRRIALRLLFAEQCLGRAVCIAESQALDDRQNGLATEERIGRPPLLRSLLRTSGDFNSNQAVLVLLNIAASTLMPLVWSTAIEFGGLGLAPASIAAMGVIYVLYPFENMLRLARGAAATAVVWPLVVLQLLSLSVCDLQLDTHVHFLFAAEQAHSWCH
ncbi:hypothetical protein EDB89DRAFT_2231117 [Lactarius sanguifluus]|nr:hypothetical protein EDB89DRAFT_2231117 [Lactarius sanguifluus]